MVFKEVTTEREFYDTLAEHPNELVVLDFFAPWGPPCTGIEPYFEKLSNKKKGVVSMKINVDNTVFMDVLQKYNVEKLPTFVFLKNGKEIDRLEKGTQVGLETKMEQYAASNDPNFFKTCLK